ncbi:hypothetical protein FOMPIDRAFT_1123178, partial [Fomitopsis schrenkii]
MNLIQSATQDQSRQAIRDWVSTEVCGLQSHLARLLSLHNSTLPLHNLPMEVFADILRCALAGRGGRAWLIKSAGVCRYWQDIIVGTPLLWNDIDL